ncbi:MAG: ScpA family protein [bacterium]|nr:ScpA family protein [bacterium]
MNKFTLQLDSYQGPLEKLLELIEREQLPVTQISIAKVTGDFLEYVRELEGLPRGETSESPEVSPRGGVDPQLIADFLVVASKLILIKSKALLPSLAVTPEEAEEMQDLETRLALYQELRGAQRHLKRLWNPMPVMFAREFLQTVNVGFYPPPAVTPQAMESALARMLGELERLSRPTAAIRMEFANLKQKIEEVLIRLTASTSMSFSSLSTDSTHSTSSGQAGSLQAKRSELVALFLAVLHLVKEQLVNVEQGRHFGDMWVRRAHHGPIAKLTPPPVQ